MSVKTVTRDRSQAETARQATFFTRQYAVLFTGACLLAFALSGYGNSRVSQCNRLVAIINEAAAAQPEALSLTIAEDNHRLMKTAIQLDGYADQLALMEFSNQQVQAFQLQFMKLYRDTSRASGAVVTVPVTSFQAVSQVNRTFIETQEREGPLVQAVNQYCNAE